MSARTVASAAAAAPVEYVPSRLRIPPRRLVVASAWQGIETALDDLLDHFHVGRALALEFGVEYGYSLVALSNFFARAIGIDTFLGDVHSGEHESWYESTRDRLLPFPNVTVECASWQDWTQAHPDARADLIHIDIEHSYEQTYGCGLWAVEHAPVVIFHDTESFESVRAAVSDLAAQHALRFHELRGHYGLGILSR